MILVTCAIIVENRRLLATRRSVSMPHPLKWEFPGGKLKEGESPEACIVREIREELGVEVEIHQALLPVIHHYESHSIKLLPFICHILEGVISLSEHQDYSWVACDDLKSVDWLEADIEVVEMAKRRLC